MRTLLAGWVCVLAAGAAAAGDKPKEKTLPQTSTREMLKAEVRAEVEAESVARFTVRKPVGTWTREAKCEGADCRLQLTLTDDRLTLRIEHKNGSAQMVADYGINKESGLFGVIDSFEATPADDAGPARCVGQPFCVRFRVDDGVLTLKDFKGLGVGLEQTPGKDVTRFVALFCGRYTGVNSDPLVRQNQLLNQSEDLRQLSETWRRFWFNDRPSHLTPQRIHGGILKADPPTADPEVKRAKAEEPADVRTRILPPLAAGECGECDPPTDAQVLKALGPKAEGFDGTITVVKTNVLDQLTPAWFFPVVGKAYLHHCHWECRVYFVKDLRTEKPAVEVVYLDTDYVRLSSADQIVVPKVMPGK